MAGGGKTTLFVGKTNGAFILSPWQGFEADARFNSSNRGTNVINNLNG